MEKLRDLRIKAKLTQLEAAKMFGISLRSYRDYENDPAKEKTIKYVYFVEQFNKMLLIDEQTGLITIDFIKETCAEVFKKYEIRSCYLFGSYAKGKAKPKSDVDLLVDTDVTGMAFFGLIEELRVSLHKVVDLLDIRQVIANPELLQEILKDGIKVYG